MGPGCSPKLRGREREGDTEGQEGARILLQTHDYYFYLGSNFLLNHLVIFLFTFGKLFCYLQLYLLNIEVT